MCGHRFAINCVFVFVSYNDPSRLKFTLLVTLGVVIAIILAIILLVACCRRHHQRQLTPRDQPEGVQSVPPYIEPRGTPLFLELLEAEGVLRNEVETESGPSYIEPLGTPSYLELLETENFNEGILRKEEVTEELFLTSMYMFYVYVLVHIQSLV